MSREKNNVVLATLQSLKIQLPTDIHYFCLIHFTKKKKAWMTPNH